MRSISFTQADLELILIVPKETLHPGEMVAVNIQQHLSYINDQGMLDVQSWPMEGSVPL